MLASWSWEWIWALLAATCSADIRSVWARRMMMLVRGESWRRYSMSTGRRPGNGQHDGFKIYMSGRNFGDHTVRDQIEHDVNLDAALATQQVEDISVTETVGPHPLQVGFDVLCHGRDGVHGLRMSASRRATLKEDSQMTRSHTPGYQQSRYCGPAPHPPGSSSAAAPGNRPPRTTTPGTASCSRRCR